MWLFGKKARYEKKTEKVDPTPVSETIHFDRPLTLEERVRRAIRTELAQKDRAPVPDGFDFEDPPEFVSEHELVTDEPTGMEVTKHEKRWLDSRRAEFDGYVTEVKKKRRSSPPRQKAEDDQKAGVERGAERGTAGDTVRTT